MIQTTITAIDYGKAEVTAYRFNAKPLQVSPIPESNFTGRANTLFAVQVDVQVLGRNFVPAYTEGDNSNVVATDSMKNFILKQALEFDGATLEGYLMFLGQQFLERYPEMEALNVVGEEQPFEVAFANGQASDVLFYCSQGDRAVAELSLERTNTNRGVGVSTHRCGRTGLQLVKVTGSSFANFVRDEHTTLPEMVDRPLFIYLDIFWRYADVNHAVSNDSHYVPAEQVRDVATTVFHEFNSKSIQHLAHEMGERILGRFPQLAEVSFEAQNRLWDKGYASEADERVKVHTDPRPPYGHIGLTMKQAEAQDG